MRESPKPLSYLCTECVLKYCKADLRVSLSQYSPIINRIERILPFKIKKLKFGPMYVALDDTEYCLQAINKFANSPQFGCFECDLDPYGVPVGIRNWELGPGDIAYQRGNPDFKDFYPDLETSEFIMSQIIGRDVLRWNDPILKEKPKFAVPELVDPSYCDIKLTDYVRFYKDRENFIEYIERFREDNRSGNPNFIECGTPIKPIKNGRRMTVHEYAPKSGPILQIAHLQLSRIERISLIEQLQARILPLQLRHYKKPPSFKTYLQLTTVSPRGIKKEAVEYRQSIHVAMKYLIEKLLGGRGVIDVNHLEFDNDEAILHLPKSLKINLKHLKTARNGRSVISNFLPFISEASFPLKSVESSCEDLYMHERNYCHPILETAKKFIVPALYSYLAWDLVLIKLTNSSVHMRNGYLLLYEVALFIDLLIEEYESGEKFTGNYTFGITSPTFAEEIVPTLLKKPAARIGRMPGVM